MRGFPGVTFGVHLCRGNRRSMWHREGSYDAIAERLFNGLAHDRFLLEYDRERAGRFAPLRFVPKGKVAVLGLDEHQGAASWKGIEELQAADRGGERGTWGWSSLALSPQCGFASMWWAIWSAQTTRSASSRWWWRPRGRCGVNKCEGTPPGTRPRGSIGPVLARIVLGIDVDYMKGNCAVDLKQSTRRRHSVASRPG